MLKAPKWCLLIKMHDFGSSVMRGNGELLWRFAYLLPDDKEYRGALTERERHFRDNDRPLWRA
jgi:hypothetical protein